MLAQQVMPFVTEEDYLEMEAASSIRHDYVEGYIYAMAGGTKSHNKIAINIGAALHQQVKGTACDVFLSDVKLKIADRHCYYYPDIMLGCSRDETDELSLSKPCLLIEVLSKSTETTDRREKLAAYQSISSLREYCLVAQDKPCLERYHRLNENALWYLMVYEKGDSVQFSCIDYTLSMDDIYAGVLNPFHQV
jgi:Uma2 family endonuclease